LLRIVAALSRPTSGSVRVAGVDLSREGKEARRRIGYLSHQPLLYEDLTGEENLRFYGTMYDVADVEGRITAMLDQVGLQASRRDLVRTYSRGMKQRLSIARAFLHDPSVLLLDEPYTGLDQQASEMLDSVLRDVGAGSRTAVLTTHNLERGLAISHRVAMLVGGRVTHELSEADRDLDRFRQEYARQAARDGVIA
jgi:heme exporter protein A